MKGGLGGKAMEYVTLSAQFVHSTASLNSALNLRMTGKES